MQLPRLRCIYKLIVSHSHSCGPDWDTPCPKVPGKSCCCGFMVEDLEDEDFAIDLLLDSSASPISKSGILTLLCRRSRFGWTVTPRASVAFEAFCCDFGGPGAMGTTPPLPAAAPAIPGPVPAEPPPELPIEPVVDFGDSDSLGIFPELGVVTGVWTIEFFRDDFLDDRVEPLPTFTAALPLPRLRFLMTSVFKESGRTTPCNLRKRPQALHNGWPSGLRRHSGVVCVKQLVHVVG